MLLNTICPYHFNQCLALFVFDTRHRTWSVSYEALNRLPPLLQVEELRFWQAKWLVKVGQLVSRQDLTETCVIQEHKFFSGLMSWLSNLQHHRGFHVGKGAPLGVMLCYSCLKILNFWARDCRSSFWTGNGKLRSSLHVYGLFQVTIPQTF